MVSPSHLLAFSILVLTCPTVFGQRTEPPPQLSDELCGCMGAINLKSDDDTFDLAVKHCLNVAVMDHPAEVLALLHRYPDEKQKAYLLGLLIGGTLDRTCSQYPAVKERLRSISGPTPHSRPST